jgi:tetratricopeptide (TPR) repeat protein
MAVGRLKFLALMMATCISCAGCATKSVVPDFPDQKYRLWLSGMQQAFSELRKEHLHQSGQLYTNCLEIAKSCPHAYIECALSATGLAQTEAASGDYASAIQLLQLALINIRQQELRSQNDADVRHLEFECLQSLLLAQTFAGAGKDTEKPTYERACRVAATLPDSQRDPAAVLSLMYADVLFRKNRKRESTYMNLQGKQRECAYELKHSGITNVVKKKTEELAHAFCDFADSLVREREPQSALDAYESALTLIHGAKVSGSAEEFRARVGLADVHSGLGHADPALKLYSETLDWLRSHSPTRSLEIARVLRSRGTLLHFAKNDQVLSLRDLDAAVAESRLAVRRQSSADSLNELGLNLFYLGSIQRNTGQFEQAEKSFKDAIAIRRRSPVDAYSSLADMLFQYGRLKLMETKADQAVPLFLAALQAHHRDPNHGEQVSLITYHLAHALYFSNRPLEAKRYYQEVVNECAAGKWVNRDRIVEQSKSQLAVIDKGQTDFLKTAQRLR